VSRTNPIPARPNAGYRDPSGVTGNLSIPGPFSQGHESNPLGKTLRSGCNRDLETLLLHGARFGSKPMPRLATTARSEMPSDVLRGGHFSNEDGPREPIVARMCLSGVTEGGME
jgi:hypothetical protein